MRHLLSVAALLLSGCASSLHPLTTEVDKKQEYAMPEHFACVVQVVEREVFLAICPVGDYGCVTEVTGMFEGVRIPFFVAYVVAGRHVKYSAEHECNHAIYGGEHLPLPPGYEYTGRSR